MVLLDCTDGGPLASIDCEGSNSGRLCLVDDDKGVARGAWLKCREARTFVTF